MRDSFRGLYRLCFCGCGKLRKCVDKQGRLKQFINGHILKGYNSSSWKGGRKKQNNYWMILIPDYYKSDCNGYISEHIYFYEQYHKVCVLKWTVVHHIEPVTEYYCNNMPWNLTTMIRGDHISYHKKGVELVKKDTSDKRCSNPNCKDPNNRYFSKDGYEQWYNNENNEPLCRKCYNKWYDKNKRVRKTKLSVIPPRIN